MPLFNTVYTVIHNLNKCKADLIIKPVEKWLECIAKYSCYCLLNNHCLIYISPALSSASNHMLQCSIYLGSFGPAWAFISETAIKIWWKRKESWDCSRFPDPSWMLRGGKWLLTQEQRYDSSVNWDVPFYFSSSDTWSLMLHFNKSPSTTPRD